MKSKITDRSSTYALKNGGFVHIDRLIMPIKKPKKEPGTHLDPQLNRRLREEL